MNSSAVSITSGGGGTISSSRTVWSALFPVMCASANSGNSASGSSLASRANNRALGIRFGGNNRLGSRFRHIQPAISSSTASRSQPIRPPSTAASSAATTSPRACNATTDTASSWFTSGSTPGNTRASMLRPPATIANINAVMPASSAAATSDSISRRKSSSAAGSWAARARTSPRVNRAECRRLMKSACTPEINSEPPPPSAPELVLSCYRTLKGIDFPPQKSTKGATGSTAKHAKFTKGRVRHSVPLPQCCYRGRVRAVFVITDKHGFNPAAKRGGEAADETNLFTAKKDRKGI